MKKEICHVCKKEKKPYTIFMTNNIFEIIHYHKAREKGPICERCDQYAGITGEFKEPTDEEFEIAINSVKFANLMMAWWEKEKRLDYDGDNKNNDREWEGKSPIALWYRDKFQSKKNIRKGNKK